MLDEKLTSDNTMANKNKLMLLAACVSGTSEYLSLPLYDS